MTPMYVYPQRWYWLLRGAALLFLALLVGQSVLTWIRALLTVIHSSTPIPVDPTWFLEEPLAAVVGSLLALLIGGILGLAVGNLLVPLTLSEQGLYFHTLGRVRFVPWERVQGFFGTRVGLSTRTLLFIRVEKGAPWFHRLHGLLVGAGLKPGFLVTSDLRDFGPAMGHALGYLEALRGARMSFDEQPPSELLSMAAAPRQHLAALVSPDGGVMPISLGGYPGAMREAAKVMVGVALSLALVLLADGVWSAELRLTALLIFVLGMVEWPIGSYWLVAAGDLLGRATPWQDHLALYPTLQLPRWLAALAALALVLLRAPLGLVALPLLAGVVWSGWLLSLITQRFYDSTPQRSWLGSVVPMIYQGFLIGLLLFFMR